MAEPRKISEERRTRIIRVIQAAFGAANESIGRAENAGFDLSDEAKEFVRIYEKIRKIINEQVYMNVNS